LPPATCWSPCGSRRQIPVHQDIIGLVDKNDRRTQIERLGDHPIDFTLLHHERLTGGRNEVPCHGLGQGSCEQSLARAGWAIQQHAARNGSPFGFDFDIPLQETGEPQDPFLHPPIKMQVG